MPGIGWNGKDNTTTMTVNIPIVLELLLAACAGLALGAVYFGGLWLTVRRLPHWRQPALLMSISFLLRLVLLASGLYLMADGHWQRYAAAVPGLLIARWWGLRRIQPTTKGFKP